MLELHFFYIDKENWDALTKGQRLDGSIKIHREMSTGYMPVFNAHNRQPRTQSKLEKVKDVENGWLKRGKKYFVFHDRAPVVLGAVKAKKIFERDIQDAMEGVV
jgi:hypothetical protein